MTKQLLNVEGRQTIASVGTNIAIQTEIDSANERAFTITSTAVSMKGKPRLLIELWKDLLFKTVFLQLSTGPFWRTENWISQQLPRVGSTALAIHSCRETCYEWMDSACWPDRRSVLKRIGFVLEKGRFKRETLALHNFASTMFQPKRFAPSNLTCVFTWSRACNVLWNRKYIVANKSTENGQT